MIRRPPRSTRSDTLFPYTTLFRSTRDFGPPALAAKHCCQGCRNLLVGVLWQRKVGAMVPHTPCFPRAELPQRRSRWPHYGRRRGMPLWAIEAIAVSEDSRWQDFPIWAEAIGRAHVRTPVTNAHLVCRLLRAKTHKLRRQKHT